jgi:hypothetical protein
MLQNFIEEKGEHLRVTVPISKKPVAIILDIARCFKIEHKKLVAIGIRPSPSKLGLISQL